MDTSNKRCVSGFVSHSIRPAVPGVRDLAGIRRAVVLPRSEGSARDWLGSSGRAAVVGFVVWLVGLFMVQFGSNFELFHFRLDPWQTFPTLVIGLLLSSQETSRWRPQACLHLDSRQSVLAKLSSDMSANESSMNIATKTRWIRYAMSAAVAASIVAPLPLRLAAAATRGGPVAIAIAADDRGVVLHSNGTLTELDVSAGKLGAVLFKAPGGHIAIDTDAVAAGSGARACVSLQRQDGLKYSSWFITVLDRGGPVWTWLRNGAAQAGCVLDRSGKRGYVVSALNGEISTIEFQGREGTQSYLTRIPGTSLGPLAMDRTERHLPRRRRGKGAIISIDIGNSTFATVGISPKGTSEPIALDAANKSLCG